MSIVAQLQSQIEHQNQNSDHCTSTTHIHNNSRLYAHLNSTCFLLTCSFPLLPSQISSHLSCNTNRNTNYHLTNSNRSNYSSFFKSIRLYYNFFQFFPPFSHTNFTFPFPTSFYSPSPFFKFPSPILSTMSSIHVLLTGAQTFIGSALTKTLISAGYIVHAVDSISTSTSTSITPSRTIELSNTISSQIRYFNHTDLDQAVSGCTFAIHTDSAPDPSFGLSPDAQTISQSIRYTQNVLQTCKQAATVQSVILMSSHMAITQGGRRLKKTKKRTRTSLKKTQNGNEHNGDEDENEDENEDDETYVFCESDWNTSSTQRQLPLYYAHAEMERQAWTWYKANANTNTDSVTNRMQLIVLNPAVLWGSISGTSGTSNNTNSNTTTTTASSSSSSSSSNQCELNSPDTTSSLSAKDWLVAAVRGEYRGILDLSVHVVHVYDVTRAVITIFQRLQQQHSIEHFDDYNNNNEEEEEEEEEEEAISSSSSSNNLSGRYILCTSEPPIHLRDVVRIMHEEFDLVLPATDLTDPTLSKTIKLASHVAPGGAQGQYIRANLGLPVVLSNKKFQTTFPKFQFTSSMDVLRETIRELIDRGCIEKTTATSTT